MSESLPPPLPSAPGEQTEAAKSRASRTALAFEGVFGREKGPRSSDQRLVLDHLRLMCGRDGPVFDADKVGNFDPLRAAHRDGAQTQYLIIKRQLRIAAKLGTEKKKVVPKK